MSGPELSEAPPGASEAACAVCGVMTRLRLPVRDDAWAPVRDDAWAPVCSESCATAFLRVAPNLKRARRLLFAFVSGAHSVRGLDLEETERSLASLLDDVEREAERRTRERLLAALKLVVDRGLVLGGVPRAAEDLRDAVDAITPAENDTEGERT